jgi:hypothetical protein
LELLQEAHDTPTAGHLGGSKDNRLTYP